MSFTIVQNPSKSGREWIFVGKKSIDYLSLFFVSRLSQLIGRVSSCRKKQKLASRSTSSWKILDGDFLRLRELQCVVIIENGLKSD
jgi:hypothetical protein